MNRKTKEKLAALLNIYESAVEPYIEKCFEYDKTWFKQCVDRYKKSCPEFDRENPNFLREQLEIKERTFQQYYNGERYCPQPVKLAVDFLVAQAKKMELYITGVEKDEPIGFDCFRLRKYIKSLWSKKDF